jgi:hypothetical protein
VPTDHELVLTPTRVATEGTGSSNAPYVVATDVSGGGSATAWIDGDDASYAKSDAGRSSKGTYPLWSDVDPTIDPTWVTAIGVRFRIMCGDNSHYVIQLFGQTSKLLSNPFHGGHDPLVIHVPGDWEDVDYVVPPEDYDTGGWAPDGVQSALEQTFIYCHTVPTDVTGEFTGASVLLVAEQSIVIYYTTPDVEPPAFPPGLGTAPRSPDRHPLRLYPRKDGRGPMGSAARVWPTEGNRIVGNIP